MAKVVSSLFIVSSLFKLNAEYMDYSFFCKLYLVLSQVAKSDCLGGIFPK
jgi:hypothetical protein